MKTKQQIQKQISSEIKNAVFYHYPFNRVHLNKVIVLKWVLNERKYPYLTRRETFESAIPELKDFKK